MPPNDRTDADQAAAALAAMDRILAHRPRKDGHDFSEATSSLCELRDRLIRRQGNADSSPRERERLERLNAVISVVVGGHFPLGAIPWDEIEKARAWMADLEASNL